MLLNFRAHFGRAIGANGFVSDESLAMFLRSVVAPAFPGFTLTHALGYWEGEAEPSFTLDVLAPEEERSALVHIAEIYCERFAQESVLVYSTPATGAQFVQKVTKAA